MRPFEHVVREHGATVFRVCRAVAGPEDAEDAWSETFLAALKAYPQLGPEANLEAWLVTIAHRKAIDLRRSASRRATPVAEPPDRSAPGEEPADAALWAAVRALPTKQRLAVAYHHIAGLPHREVAAIVGGSEQAARRAASDGIARLRQIYTPALRPAKVDSP